MTAAERDALVADAEADLRTLVRFDTTNPPGNEGPAIDWLAARLGEVGITSTIVRSEERPNLVARIEGTGEGGGPLLLAGHVDVVPVDREHWSCDPFAAEERGGYLYGRGTLDMKYVVTQALTAFRAIAMSGRRPDRDIIFCAVSDEEAGCTHGSRYLVEEHPDLVRAEYMLGEFGGFPQDVNGVRYYLIQVGEKGVFQFRLTAHGDPGHGSIPHDTNAVVRLARALEKLGTTRLPVHPTETARAFLKGLAAAQKPPARQVLPLVLTPALRNLVLDRLLPDRNTANSMAAIVANTVSPTMLDAGTAKNVIPGAASAVLDGRLVPGQTKDDLLREIKAVIGEGFDIETITYAEGRETTGFADDPLYRAICDNVRTHDPSGVPVPYLLTGFSDAQQFGRLGARCFGYAPVRFPVEDQVKFSTLVHGHDERIHLEGFRWGTQAFLDLVLGFVGLGGPT